MLMSGVSVRDLPAEASAPARVVFWALQPALLLGVLAAWLADPANPALLGLTFLGVHVAVENRLRLE